MIKGVHHHCLAVFLFKDLVVILIGYECFVCMYVCMCTMCVSGASEGQKGVSHLLEQITVSHHVGVENCTQF